MTEITAPTTGEKTQLTNRETDQETQKEMPRMMKGTPKWST